MRNEYPRPELVRENWISLDEEWDFDFDFSNSLYSTYLHFNPMAKITYNVRKEPLTQKINVPFVPECELSGINYGYKDYINACWYSKKIKVSHKPNERVLLNFEGAHHTTDLFIEGKHIGHHEGGYTPFTFDITDSLNEKGEATLLVHCYGDSRDATQPSGKQAQLNYPWGCFYIRNTGIWAPVWLEVVPENRLDGIKITPDTDNSQITAQLKLCGTEEKEITLTAKYNGKTVGETTIKVSGNTPTLYTQVKLSELNLWDLDNPNLYDLYIKVNSKTCEDNVKSYFGMRKLELDKFGMILNGKRVFQRLVLDQGYYKGSLITAPDAKCFSEDIMLSKKMGFNGARLHQKVFERGFLYAADKLGYLCWGEYASWGFDHSADWALQYYLPQWLESVERDYNHPSIIGWCPMNENWDYLGKRQNSRFMAELYYETKRLDPTRPVIDCSHNYHVKTDYWDIHDYVQDKDTLIERYGKFEDGKIFDPRAKEQPEYEGQPFFISEFGGVKMTTDKGGWGYNTDIIDTEDKFVDRLDIFRQVFYNNPRICAICYTQLTDVEQECNGLYYYDRKDKFSKETIEKLHNVFGHKSAYEELEIK